MGYELASRAPTVAAPASQAGVASPGKSTLVEQSYSEDEAQVSGQCDANEGAAASGERQSPPAPRVGIQQLFGRPRPAQSVAPASSDGTTTLQAATSIGQFKQMVKDAGRLRMDSNRARLEDWKAFVTSKLTGDQVASQVKATRANQLGTMAANEGGMAMSAFDAWANTDNPMLAWVKEQQIEGRDRACSGCHDEVQADELWKQRPASMTAASPMVSLQLGAQSEAASPMARPSAASDAVPDASQFRGNPGAAQAMQAVRAIQPYLAVLGPARYDILPADLFTSARSGDELRAKIVAGLDRRRADYELFKAKIAASDFDYLLLHPIVQDLLPLASPEVQRAVQDEVAHARSWSIVKAIVVGAATIGALVMTIFPPTSALGIAAMTGLDAAMASYGLVEGIGKLQEGALLANGRGAHDVIDPEQQKSADTMMAMGLLNVGMSALSLPAVGFKTVSLIRGPVDGAAVGKVTAIEAQLADGGSIKISELAGASPKIVVLDKEGKLVAEGELSDSVLTGRPTKLSELPANGIKGATPRAGTPERPVSFQGKAPTCGPVCDEMIASMAGPVDPVLLQRMLAEAGAFGTTPEKMVMLLKWNKIVAEAKVGWKVSDLAAATQGGNPAIATIRTASQGHGLHYVVVDGVTVRNGVRVVAVRNPWGIQYFQSESEFAKIFTGQAIKVSHWMK